MCGIAGIVNRSKSVQVKDLEVMADALQHRGPDGSGFFLDENIGLAHRRLSIIDLQGGEQPMHTTCGRFVISYNGELYNYKELRQELYKKGHVFHSHSDTEVVLLAYKEWQMNCLPKFRGMFAFAILDKEKHELFLARDHFGIKPLVYVNSEKVFAFASEIQALRTVPALQWDIDLASVDRYLQYKYIPAPYTIYKSAKKLPPAHYMRVNRDGQIIELNRYWQWKFQPDERLSEKDCLSMLDSAIRESVKAHLVGDVPFGAFLSGGIDSSLVVKYMTEIMDQPVKTFSIGFEHNSFDESHYAKEVAFKFGTDHYQEVVSVDALDILPDLMKHIGEPFGDNSIIPMYHLSKMTQQHVTMVLSGDAGDELFAGYESYTDYWSRQYSAVPEHLGFPKKQLYPLMHHFIPKKYPLRTHGYNDWMRYSHMKDNAYRSGLWKEEVRKSFQREEIEMQELAFREAAKFEHFQKAQYTDFQVYLPNDILTKVDITTMMHGLESRTPLLDLNVLEVASKIPERYNIAKIHGLWTGKLLPKKLLGDHFGHDFIYRKKQGFASPVEHWLFSDGKVDPRVSDILFSDTQVLSWLRPEAIAEMKGVKGAHTLWNLICLETWLRGNS